MHIINKPFVYRQFNAVWILAAVNVLVFIAQKFFGQGFTLHLSLVPALVFRGEWWTFVTYMFVHGSYTHIIFNMLALLIFGMQIERYMGSIEFLVYYFVTGILAGAFSFGAYILTGGWNYQLIGASGALFAVQLAYAVFFPAAVIYFWAIIPLRAPLAILAFTVIELFSSVTGINSGVAHFTHLAGFFFGWIYFVVRFRMNPWKRLFSRQPD